MHAGLREVDPIVITFRGILCSASLSGIKPTFIARRIPYPRKEFMHVYSRPEGHTDKVQTSKIKLNI